RGSELVGGTQGAALVRSIHKRHREIAAPEPRGRLAEVGLAGELEAEHVDFRSAGLPQHDRMVVTLLDAAQIERVRLSGGFQQPETVDVEGPGAVKIAHAECDVARPYHVERRLKIWLADRHAVGSELRCGEHGWFRRLDTSVVRSFAVDFQISVYM